MTRTTVSIIDVIHHGSHGHWPHKIRVTCNLYLDLLLVLSILLFDLRQIVENIKRLFQASVELRLSLTLLMLLYNSFYILVAYIFPPSF